MIFISPSFSPLKFLLRFLLNSPTVLTANLNFMRELWPSPYLPILMCAFSLTRSLCFLFAPSQDTSLKLKETDINAFPATHQNILSLSWLMLSYHPSHTVLTLTQPTMLLCLVWVKVHLPKKRGLHQENHIRKHSGYDECFYVCCYRVSFVQFLCFTISVS